MNLVNLKRCFNILVIFSFSACSLLGPRQVEYTRLQRLPASFSQSGLEELENVLQQANSLEEFLQNHELRENYYLHLLKYYGKEQGQFQTTDFKNYYQMVLGRLEEMTRENPELAERVWERLESAEQKSFQVSGTLNSSGIGLNSQSLQAQYLPQLQNDLRGAIVESHRTLYPENPIESVDQLSSEQLEDIIQKVLNDFDEANSLGKKEKGLAIKALKESASMRLVQSHYALKFLESPNVAEMIQTKDADIIMQALKRLPKVSIYSEQLAGEKGLPGLFNISDASWMPTLGEIEEFFEDARKLKRDFELIASAGTDDRLIRQTNQEKRELIEKGARENPLFYLETIEQAHNKKVILKQAGSVGKEVRVISVPRRFHALFRAARHDECVKEKCSKWGSAFMRDADFYFTETGNQKMTGYLQILPVRSAQSDKLYGALEVMTSSTGGEVVSLDESGLKLKKTTKFDMMIDELHERLPENIQSLVTSDGNLANNASGKNAVYQSRAYALGELISEKPGQLELVLDDLTQGLSIEGDSRYSSQKFIGDGVNRDGSELRLLLPKQKRRVMSYEEFLPQYLKSVLRKNNNMLESLKFKAEASNLDIPNSETVSRWRQFEELPLEQLSDEDVKEILNIDQTFLNWIEKRDYLPGEDPFVDKWVNDSEFFKDILSMIKKRPNHLGSQRFYRFETLRKKFLDQGGQALATEMILGDNRDLERRFLDAISNYMSPHELFEGAETTKSIQDWFFQSENITSFTHLKRRKNFSMLSGLFDQDELFQEFYRRFLAGDYYERRELIQVFSRSLVFQDLSTPLVREWEGLLETQAMREFLKDEVGAGVSDDFLKKLLKKSESLGTRSLFESELTEAFKENISSEKISLNSHHADYLDRNKVFKSAPDLKHEFTQMLKKSSEYELLLEQVLDSELIPNQQNMGWAQFIALNPIEDGPAEKMYHEIMGKALAERIDESFSLEHYNRHNSSLKFSYLLKAMVEKHHTRELQNYMFESVFLQSYLEGLKKRTPPPSLGEFAPQRLGVKFDQKMASSNSALALAAQNSEANRQMLYSFYQDILDEASASVRTGVVENLNSLMSGSQDGVDRGLELILNSESFPGLKLLSESRPDLVKQAFNNEKFIEQVLGVYLLDFLHESQQAAPAVRSEFFKRLEGSSLEKRMQEELIPALFQKGRGTQAHSLLKKPFIDLYSSKTHLGREVLRSSLEYAPEKIFTHLALLGQSLKNDEFPYEILEDERFISQVDQNIGKLPFNDAAPVAKLIKGAALQKLESSENYVRFLGSSLYQIEALTKGEQILTFKNFFQHREFYQGLFESIDERQTVQAFKFLMKPNISVHVDQLLMREELNRHPMLLEKAQALLFSGLPERRKVMTSFIQAFPSLAQDNPKLVERIRDQMLTPHKRDQADLINMLKSKGGQTLLRQGRNREVLLEDLKNSDLEDVQKQRFFKVLFDEANPSCQSMMGSFL